VLNATDASLRDDERSARDEIGGMAVALMMARRRQLGGDIPTQNDFRRIENIIAIAMDARPLGETARAISARDASTPALDAVGKALSVQETDRVIAAFAAPPSAGKED